MLSWSHLIVIDRSILCLFTYICMAKTCLRVSVCRLWLFHYVLRIYILFLFTYIIIRRACLRVITLEERATQGSQLRHPLILLLQIEFDFWFYVMWFLSRKLSHSKAAYPPPRLTSKAANPLTARVSREGVVCVVNYSIRGKRENERKIPVNLVSHVLRSWDVEKRREGGRRREGGGGGEAEALV